MIAEVTAPDGTKSFPFGPKPRGMVIFTPEGDFAQIHIASEVPKIASGNRLNASPEEYAAIMRGTIAQFGTYTVDEEKRTFTMKFAASTFPNWEGALADAHDRQAHRRGIHQYQSAGRRRPRLGLQSLQARAAVETARDYFWNDAKEPVMRTSFHVTLCALAALAAEARRRRRPGPPAR